MTDKSGSGVDAEGAEVTTTDDMARPSNEAPTYELEELGAILVGTVTDTQQPEQCRQATHRDPRDREHRQTIGNRWR